MFYITYFTIYNVQMHDGAISKLLYDFASVRLIIHSLIFPHSGTNHTITYTYLASSILFETTNQFTLRMFVTCTCIVKNQLLNSSIVKKPRYININLCLKSSFSLSVL